MNKLPTTDEEARLELCAALGISPNHAAYALNIVRRIQEATYSGLVYHPESDKLYVEHNRRPAHKRGFKNGWYEWGGGSPWKVTDDFRAKETIVMYQRVEDDKLFAAPARLFDDGRFIRIGSQV